MSLTTLITTFENNIENTLFEYKSDELDKIIFDFSINHNDRIQAFIQYYNQIDFNNFIEIIYRLSSMYQLSGTKILEQYLYSISTLNISSFGKLETIKALLAFEEYYDKDTTNINDIIEKNKKRKNIGYDSLNQLCNNFQDLPTPCKLEAIYLLMESEQFQSNANQYFCIFINNNDINSDYRYKSILAIELKNNIINKNFFILNSCLNYLYNIQNDIQYRILAAQYLLQKIKLNNEQIETIEKIILEIAENKNNDYNRRADAADLLLRLASTENKNKAKNIIIELGKNGKNIKSIFDNAQNIHNEEIENSAMEILDYLSNIPLLKINNKFIDFDFVYKQIINIINSEKIQNNCNKLCKHKKCKYCQSCNKKTFNNYFCSKKCFDNIDNYDKIISSLNRISMDRILYSKYNNTLSGILLKIWTYIENNEYKNEMKKRLLEELQDMSGTCSSGFASRLINVLSGFGEFNIRISWDDQIMSNLTGRLNKFAQQITQTDSIYYTKYKEPIKENYKNIPDIYNSDFNNIIQEFAYNVINELTNNSSDYTSRTNFCLFLRITLPIIKEDLYQEFKDHMTDTDFDLYMRKGVMMYESGESF
jgi:hypothetical protein